MKRPTVTTEPRHPNSVPKRLRPSVSVVTIGTSATGAAPAIPTTISQSTSIGTWRALSSMNTAAAIIAKPIPSAFLPLYGAEMEQITEFIADSAAGAYL